VDEHSTFYGEIKGAARGNAKSLFTPAGLTPSFILDSLKRSKVKASKRQHR
jgi:hypothetical protein